MTTNVIELQFGKPAQDKGNGAREALIATALALPNGTTQDDAECWTDWILGELYMRGFKVVPR